MLESCTDLELIDKFKAGCQESFEELIGRYSDKAFSLAFRFTHNAQDAEEVLQDVFVTVFRKVGGFEGKSTFSSWLYRVTVNAALMKVRKKKQEQSVSIEDVMPAINARLAQSSIERGDLDRAASRRQVLGAISEAISRLPEEYRPVFVLRDVDGLSSREVGRILKLTIPAVKSRLHRSRLMLRRRLARMFRELEGEELPDTERAAGNF